MAGLAWDEYLFKMYKLVALDPWSDESLALMDVFTMRGSHGIVNRGPKLAHTGALTNPTTRSEELSTHKRTTRKHVWEAAVMSSQARVQM